MPCLYSTLVAHETKWGMENARKMTHGGVKTWSPRITNSSCACGRRNQGEKRGSMSSTVGTMTGNTAEPGSLQIAPQPWATELLFLMELKPQQELALAETMLLTMIVLEKSNSGGGDDSNSTISTYSRMNVSSWGAAHPPGKDSVEESSSRSTASAEAQPQQKDQQQK